MTAMTPEQAIAYLMENEPVFKVHETDIRGVTYKTFKNIPPNVPTLMLASREAQENGQAEYVIFEDERYTYDDFCARANRLANALKDQFGIGKGDRVAIAMRNYPELLLTTLATAQLGAVTVFLNAWWTTEELEYALTDSDAKLVVADGVRCERLQSLIEPLSLTVIGARNGEATAQHKFSDLQKPDMPADFVQVPIDTDDDFAIMYSSGTTGHPKGVVQTHRGAVNAVFSWLLQFAAARVIDPPDPDAPPLRPAGLVVTPLFHVTATHPLFLLSMPAGAKVVLMRKWDPERAVTLIRDEQITRFLGVPTQSAELMKAATRMNDDLSTLDYLGSGGAKRPAAQVAKLAEAFPDAGIATGWGMTETNALGMGAIGDDYKERPDSAGKLHAPLQELRFLDDDGNDVPTGEVGEITVKSPANMRCYLNQPEATAQALQDGWLRTGDLGWTDSDGWITIVDRKKNIIIRGGENIACLDVEGALHRHPDVIEACIFSVPDERLGETVGAAVQTAGGKTLSVEEITDFLDGHLAKFKMPEHIWCQETPLMRGTTDKIDARGMREKCLASRGIKTS